MCTAMSGLVGKNIDVYEITRLLGKGGMGEVYEARHSIIGRTCAIKVLPVDEKINKELVGRMIREAQAASMLGHPNIVQIFDFRMDSSGRFFMVMELLQGKSLAELLAEHGALSIEVASTIAMQVLSALAGAHAKGVVHRDLKPDNIFLALDPTGNYKVKLLDFGISKFMTMKADDMRLTQTGAVLGTPYYMSPEQAEGKKNLDGRSDLWSCGTIIYEMVTGGVPFYGDSYNEVMAAILMKPFAPPSHFVPDLDPGVERIIMKAMEKKLDNRYATAADFFMDLMPYHSSEEVHVGSMTFMPPYTGTNPLMSLQRMVAAAAAEPLDSTGGHHISRLESVQVSSASSLEPGGEGKMPFGYLAENLSRAPSIESKTSISRLKILLAVTVGAVLFGAVFAISVLFFGGDAEKNGEDVVSEGKSEARISDLVRRPEIEGSSGKGSGGMEPTKGPSGADGEKLKNAAEGENEGSGDNIDDGKLEKTGSGVSGVILEKNKMKVELLGLPKNARVHIDDEKVEPPVVLEADGKKRCVKVWGSRRRFFVKCFKADGDKTFRVKLRRVKRGTRTRNRVTGRPSKYDNPYKN